MIPNNDIRDDEFRIIGAKQEVFRESERISEKKPSEKPPFTTEKRIRILSKGKMLWPLLVLAVILFTVLLWVFIHFSTGRSSLPPETITTVPDTLRQEAPVPVLPFVERKDTIINDIPLSLFIPHNATPTLAVGITDELRQNAILGFQAADIRQDNEEILGAFVLNGKLLSRGISKKGFCAIIDGKITLGNAESTSLFEKAVEKDGCFFRQYPLVSDGVLINSGPKGKGIRKALCSAGGQVFVAVSGTEESFHDFSQALVDLGVEDAIYLCGGSKARGWYHELGGELISCGENDQRFRHENYILWTSSTMSLR